MSIGGRDWAGISAILLLCATVPVALGTQLPIRTYTTADGLPRNAAYCIVPDSRGFVWLCTTDGLARFDGKTFDLFGVAQGLPSRRVSEFLETKAGLQFASTDHGVVQLDPDAPAGSAHQFFSIPTKDGTPSKRVDELFQDAGGVVWAGTVGGIYRLENANGKARLAFEKIGRMVETSILVGAFSDDGRGGLWVGTNVGLCHRTHDGRFEWFTGRHDPVGEGGVNALLLDKKSNLWVGTLEGLWMANLLNQSERPVFHAYREKDGLASQRIHALFQAADGTVWAGTARGISQLQTSPDDIIRFRSYRSDEGLRGRVVFAINETRDGSLWVGVDHGLARIPKSGFLRYSTADGIGELGVTGFIEDREGHFFAVSNEEYGSQLHRLDGARFRSIRPNYPAAMKGAGWGVEQVALVDHTGEWWFAAAGGLIRFPAVAADDLAHTKPLAFYKSKDDLGGGAILRVFEDSSGRIWSFAIPGGLAVWSRSSNSFRRFSKTEFPGYATAFAEDHDGDVWIGSSVEAGMSQSSKLFRLRDGIMEQISLPGNQESWISTLYIDRAGHLWVGTTENGLSKVADPTCEQVEFSGYGVAQGLSSFAVTAIAEDQSGRIYAATPRGVDQLDPASGRIQHYSAADGIPASSIVAMKRDRKGHLWLATALGVASFQPPSESPTLIVPVVFKTVLVNGKPRALREDNALAVELNPDENQLQMQFSAPTAPGNESVRYEYKLNGSVSGWSQPALEGTVNYFNLPPGDYRFEVRSVLAGGLTGPTAQLPFIIKPHFWQRWWFMLLVVAGMGGLAFAWHRHELERRLELERVRARIAADLHDDLGANLTRVVILSEVAQRQTNSDNREVGERLSEIADTARGLADSLSDLVWSINPLRDDVPSLLNRLREFASDVLESQGIAWSLTTSESIEGMPLMPEQRWQLFLIAKEAIHNAARHSGCTSVALQLQAADGWATVSITDDGCGLPREQPAHETGNGLANMRKRAKALGGEVAVGTEPGGGVRVELRFPLESSACVK